MTLSNAPKTSAPISSAPRRASKLCTAQDALAGLKDGQTVFIGGSLFHSKPMALVREIVRRKVRNLTVMSPCQASMDVDLLIAAGCAARVGVPYLGFDYLGLAPAFRKRTSDGTLYAWECDETMVLCGLEAAAKDLPSGITKTGVGTDLPRLNADFKEVADHITGEPMIAVPAFKIDYALLHTAAGDEFGNLRYPGFAFADTVLAEATKRSGGIVVASVDELQPLSYTEAAPHATMVSQMLVDHVVEAAFGAHPCSSHGNYQHDEAGLLQYLEAVRNGEAGIEHYIRKFVTEVPTQADYLDAHVKPSTLVQIRKGIYV